MSDMFLESEAKFQKLEKNKGEITTDKEKIEYMHEQVELLKDLVVKLERDLEYTQRELRELGELRYKINSCNGCKYSNY